MSNIGAACPSLPLPLVVGMPLELALPLRPPQMWCSGGGASGSGTSDELLELASLYWPKVYATVLLRSSLAWSWAGASIAAAGSPPRSRFTCSSQVLSKSEDGSSQYHFCSAATGSYQ